MCKKYKKIIVFLGIFFVFLLQSSVALALEVQYPDIFGLSINNTTSFPEYAKYFFNIGMVLAAFIALGSVAFGGIYWLVSFSRGKFTDEGKDWIKSGILGLLIVACSYLIAYTINEDLVIFKMGDLPAVSLENLLGNNANNPNLTISTYREIPLGTLTETLLTRTMDCYAFDQQGNPIDGEKIRTDEGKEAAVPTYMEHDRIDCLAQLADGAQKKSHIISELSGKIVKLMSQCDCKEYGKCLDSCNGSCGDPTACPGGSCAGPCKNGACKQNLDIEDCCPKDSGVKDPKNSKRNLTVKELVERGPIEININNVCNCEIKDTDSGCEMKTCPDGTKSCNCPSAYYNTNPTNSWLVSTASAATVKDEDTLTAMGLDEYRCPNPNNQESPCSNIASYVEKEIKVKQKTIKVIDQEKWEKLNLLQQLTYFKEKVDEVKNKVKKDLDKLNQARSEIASCYMVVPYINLVKAYETTQRDREIILTEKNYTDPETQKKTDSSKYCSGFNYSNATCYKKCNDMCPDTSKQAIDLYKQCPQCKGDDWQCLKDQETCIEKQFKERPCIYNEKNKSQKYSECLGSCIDDCQTLCGKKYLMCSNEYQICKNQCSDNSQCILDNADDCLFGSQGIKQSTDQITDQGNLDYSINRAYLCKNGSDQYAGYEDCIEPYAKNECSVSYTGSYLSEHQNCEKCANPYSPAKKGDYCYSKTNQNSSCLEVCPETTKCPASSDCPECSCTKVDKSLGFCVPYPESQESGEGESKETGEILTKKSSASQVVGPECNEYTYNDDPLTFFCENDWWTDPVVKAGSDEPIATGRIVPLAKEVPVGETVDSAKEWGYLIVGAVDFYVKDMEQLLDQIKKAGNAKNTPPIQNYCKCDAKYESGEPICKSDCLYSETMEPVYAGDGSIIGSELKCNCAFVPCNGNPCKQLMEYLEENWNYYKQIKDDYASAYSTLLADPRSDILKKLSYSRKVTKDCSLVKSSYGTKTELMSCTRVEDELISPINNGVIRFETEAVNAYCYGTELGKLFSKDITDNWFCAEERKQEAKTN